MAQQKTLNNIQALRGLAAVAVMLFHARVYYLTIGGDNAFYIDISGSGFMGVDVFFVISGYVMALTTVNKPRDLSASLVFVEKRLFRVYLGYWPFFFIALIFSLLFFEPRLEKINLLSSFFLSSFHQPELMLPVSWTLSFELYFYLLVFALFFIPKNMATLIMIALFMAIFYINVNQHIHVIPYSRFFLSAYILEFLAGYLLFLLMEKKPSSYFLPLLMLGAAVGLWVGYQDATTVGFKRVSTYGVGAFFLVATAIQLEQMGISKIPRVFKEIGNASYTLYLIHIMALWAFSVSGIGWMLKRADGWLLDLGFFAYLIIVVLISVIFYHLVEAPLYRKALGISHIRLSRRFMK